MKLLSVNQVRETKESLYGEEVFVHGIVAYTPENVLIAHWPKSEQSCEPNSEIWVHTGNGPFGFDSAVLDKMNGKHIVVRGVIESNGAMFSQDPGIWWSPHFCATALTLYGVWVKEHGTTKI